MTEILNYGRTRKELIEIAVLDQSADWEIDVTEIHYNPETKEWHLITASGCSCWDGDYEEEKFSSFEALKKSLIENTDRAYNPTLEGAKELIADAEKQIKKLNLSI